jgi:hypothetical protein
MKTMQTFTALLKKNTGLWFLWNIRLWNGARFHLWDLSISVPGARTGSNGNGNENFINQHVSISTQIHKLWKPSPSLQKCQFLLVGYIYIYIMIYIYIYKDVVSPYCFHPFSKNTGLWFLWKIRLWILARFHLWDLSSSVPGAKTGSNSNENEKFLNHHLSISTQIQKLWKQSHS